MHTKLPVAVVSIVIRNNKILLLKRKNTPWMNWYWGVPWWRLDEWESMTIWAIRELQEEVWLKINEKNINFKSIIQHKDDRWERLYFVIEVVDFLWKPINLELEKCEEIKWFALSNLPENITSQVEICLKVIQNKINYMEFWY